MTLANAGYATHIGDDPIQAFHPMRAGAKGQEFMQVLGRASNLAGTIMIEGGLLVQSSEDAAIYVYASEQGKCRWVQIAAKADDYSPWAVLEELHKVF
ncbi:hypothetical protein EVC20_097 [Rhizobium phage RHph_Y2_17_1]|nr:hypothetical protein EVC20_097 [Rhizobium phage RHph_Y2_17_1]